MKIQQYIQSYDKMEILKRKTIQSNWITYLCLFVVTVLFSTFLTPLEHGNTKLNLFLFSIFMFFTYQTILNLIGLAIIIGLDYFLFDKDRLRHFFMIETMIILFIVFLIFILTKATGPAIALTISICCSQYIRYKVINKKAIK